MYSNVLFVVNMDVFAGKIVNGDNGDVGDDFYHRYKVSN